MADEPYPRFVIVSIKHSHSAGGCCAKQLHCNRAESDHLPYFVAGFGMIAMEFWHVSGWLQSAGSVCAGRGLAAWSGFVAMGPTLAMNKVAWTIWGRLQWDSGMFQGGYFGAKHVSELHCSPSMPGETQNPGIAQANGLSIMPPSN